MINTYDIINYFKRLKKNGERRSFYLSDDDKYVIDSATDITICTLEQFVQRLKTLEHCDFETIYEDPVSLDVVLRCKQCGTIIFTSDHYEAYDKNLCCPKCGGYKPSAITRNAIRNTTVSRSS